MALKNRILPIIAAVGLIVAVVVAVRSQQNLPPAQPIALPAQAPFESYIGGAGMVEASSQNIAIGTSIPGIARKIHVKVGDRVKAGDPLFVIDDREYRADLGVREANLRRGQASLAEAKASLEDFRSQYALVRDVTDHRAVSVDEVDRRRNAEQLAAARVESAKAAIASTEAEIRAVQTTLERLTVRAPIDGEIMQVNVRPGEFAPTGVLATPLMRLGDLDRLHVRVDIDENDAWRFKPDTKAVAFIRGNRDLKTELAFVRVEPYVTPKTSLTGGSSERVDTRVLQVIYGFDRKRLPVFVGQQVDVFIEAPAVPERQQPAGKAGAGAGR